MLVRVNVANASCGGDLICRLLEEVQLEEIGFEARSRTVRVQLGPSPDGALVAILHVVEQWLAASGHAPTRVEIDEREYILGPTDGNRSTTPIALAHARSA